MNGNGTTKQISKSKNMLSYLVVLSLALKVTAKLVVPHVSSHVGVYSTVVSTDFIPENEIDPLTSIKLQEMGIQTEDHDFVLLQVKHPWNIHPNYVPQVLFVLDGGTCSPPRM